MSWRGLVDCLVALTLVGCTTEPVTEVFVPSGSDATADAAPTDTTASDDDLIDGDVSPSDVDLSDVGAADVAPETRVPPDLQDLDGAADLGGEVDSDVPACIAFGELCEWSGTPCCTSSCARADDDSFTLRCGGCTASYVGQRCDSAQDCCPGASIGCNERGYCGDEGCLGADEPCAENAECCTGRCVLGTCLDCTPLAQPCYAAEDCCTGYCDSDGRCDNNPNTCTAVNELCEHTVDCCSSAAVCYEITDGERRCVVLQ